MHVLSIYRDDPADAIKISTTYTCEHLYTYYSLHIHNSDQYIIDTYL